MVNSRKIILIPGAFQTVRNYGNYNGVDIWLKNEPEKEFSNPDYVIAHSLGVNFALTLPNLKNCKFVFINPVIEKVSFINLIIKDIKFLFLEGIKIEKIVPFSNWIYSFKKCRQLSKINVLEEIKKLPKENITIIKGVKDDYFCDKKSAEIIKREGWRLIEIGAGHDWDQNIAEAVDKIIGEN
ncbi:MAG: hypothetical protein D4Q79_02325 [Spirochaetia bacterium]|nr:MAG: hypothetical protein D4Q79_02325 [Spirochaetia bacterium]